MGALTVTGLFLKQCWCEYCLDPRELREGRRFVIPDLFALERIAPQQMLERSGMLLEIGVCLAEGEMKIQPFALSQAVPAIEHLHRLKLRVAFAEGLGIGQVEVNARVVRIVHERAAKGASRLVEPAKRVQHKAQTVRRFRKIGFELERATIVRQRQFE